MVDNVWLMFDLGIENSAIDDGEGHFSAKNCIRRKPNSSPHQTNLHLPTYLTNNKCISIIFWAKLPETLKNIYF